MWVASTQASTYAGDQHEGLQVVEVHCPEHGLGANQVHRR